MSATPAPATEDPPPAKPGKRKLLLIAAPVVLLGSVGAGLWFTGILPRLLGKKPPESKEEAARPAVPIYVELPDMVANLNGDPRRPSYLKLQSRLEVSKPEDVEHVKQAMPRLLDLFQTYLREMRPDDLRGAAGSYRLREELISRANVAAAPARITGVLFTQILIQ